MLQPCFVKEEFIANVVYFYFKLLQISTVHLDLLQIKKIMEKLIKNYDTQKKNQESYTRTIN